MIISCSITWHVPTSLSLHTLSIEVSTRVSSIIQKQTRAFKGTLGKKTYIGTESDYFNKAHYIVLQNSSLVDRISRYIRISFNLSGLGRMKLGFGIITWKPSAIGCEKNVRVMKT